MNNLVDYLDKLIEKYKKEVSFDKQTKLAKEIYAFYDCVINNEYYSKRFLKDFKRKYKEICKKSVYRLTVNKMKSNTTKNEVNEYIVKANKDLPYLNKLMKNINMDNTIYIDEEKKSNKNQILLNYIYTSKEFMNFLNSVEYDELLDENLRDSALLELPSKKYVLFLNSDNILTKMDSLMDMYNGYSFDRYFRVPCDLAELALSKKSNLSSIIDRHQNITDLKMIRNGIYSRHEYDTYCYGIASLIARALVEKYGTNFKDVVEFANILKDNSDLPLESVVKELGLTDDDIIENVNKHEKILKY